jgi:farnesyl-diphosphate synthase (EC 2.5.1.10)/geranylgeranyl-diphosphate synthase (EC 2.5.1.29)
VLEEYSRQVIEEVEKRIRQYLSGDVHELYEASRYLIEAGGKRLRPLMLVASSDLFHGDRKRSYLAGGAVEVLHNFTLIHDDIMDQDTLRRGRPTVHVKWGVPMAILAGDLLHAKAFEMLIDSVSGLDEARANDALRLFAKSVIELSEGQALDMQFEERWDVTEREYIEMVRKKTAQLFACSASLGGIIGGGTEKDVKNLFVYGEKIGISFQIVDDILGLTADERELGKPVYSDLREGKKTILLIKALRDASEEERKRILAGVKSNDQGKLRDAASLVLTISLEYATRLSESYKTEALQALSLVKSDNEEVKKLLMEVAELVTKRRK